MRSASDPCGAPGRLLGTERGAGGSGAEQWSGPPERSRRDRPLKTGKTAMRDVLTVDAVSTIMLLMAIEAMYPGKRLVHLFLDNARYHHAKLVQAWLARPECRIKLHFIPAYCPHLNPIERLWGLMHRHITHNKCYASFKDFSIAMLTFLRDDVPKIGTPTATRSRTASQIINPKDFRVLT